MKAAGLLKKEAALKALSAAGADPQQAISKQALKKAMRVESRVPKVVSKVENKKSILIGHAMATLERFIVFLSTWMLRHCKDIVHTFNPGFKVPATPFMRMSYVEAIKFCLIFFFFEC